jgi:hypothetical protein
MERGGGIAYPTFSHESSVTSQQLDAVAAVCHASARDRKALTTDGRRLSAIGHAGWGDVLSGKGSIP